MNKLLKYLYKKRAEYYADLVSPYIKKGEKVLDVGAGTGVISKILSKKADVTLLDIKDYNQTDLPLKLYDGKKIPFRDKSFDAVILVTAFHYIPNQPAFLKELKRVSSRIILVDDVYKTAFGRFISNLNDTVVSNTVGIFTKFNFLRDEDFKEMFKKTGLRLVDSKNTRSFLRITRQKIYVLGAGNSNPQIL